MNFNLWTNKIVQRCVLLVPRLVFCGDYLRGNPVGSDSDYSEKLAKIQVSSMSLLNITVITVILISCLLSVNAEGHQCYDFDYQDTTENGVHHGVTSCATGYCYRRLLSNGDGPDEVQAGCMSKERCKTLGANVVNGKCGKIDGDGDFTVTTCCCSGNLCNSAATSIASFILFAATTLLVFAL
jgi:hypothetical protein